MNTDEKYLYEDLTDKIIKCFYEGYYTLGFGFLEKIYEKSLKIELESIGLKTEEQSPIKVFYKNISVGDYYADILVEGDVILEIKAAKAIDESHKAQLLNYLRATGIHRGLILNFGTQKLGFKRMVY